MVWNILNTGFAIIAGFLAINLFGYFKLTRANHAKEESGFEYRDNPKLDSIQAAGNHNNVFKNTLSTKKIIDRYLISHDDHQPYLLCHLTGSSDDMKSVVVNEYDQHKHLVNMRLISDVKKLSEKPLIKLDRATRFVNIVSKDESAIIEHIKNKSKANNNVALRQSLMLFFLLIPLSYLILYLMVNAYTEYPFAWYINAQTIGLGLGLIAFTAALNYGFSLFVSVMRKRKGGALDE